MQKIIRLRVLQDYLNMNIGKVDKNVAKRPCPYMEKCYRKNPIHFSDMSHPHLENLLNGQLVGDIIIPSELDFECSDRNELLDQLKVLQIVLRKERGTPNIKIDPENPQNNSESQPITESSRSLPSLSPQPFDQSSLKRSQQPSTSEVDSKKAKEASPRKSENTLRRYNSNGENSKSNEMQSPKKPSEGTSIFDEFNSSTNQQTRVEIRKKTIERMVQAGQQIPHLVTIGQFDLKYALSSPYNVFLTCVRRTEETWSQPYTVTFPEMLDISLGIIEESLHFNFMVDVGWLCLQYLFAGQKADSLILLGSRCDDTPLPSNITTELIKTPTNWGTHHSKISVLKYSNGGARIIVSTANLYSDDWENRTQAVWISPHLPKLEDNQDNIQGESRTGFKHDFIDYLKQYRRLSLNPWISFLERLNFSSIDVFFLASVPGNYKGSDRSRFGLRRLANILGDHADMPADSQKWSIIAQCSSIGSLGVNYGAWLSKEFVPAMANEKQKALKSAPNFHFVYPSIKNYENSFDAQVGSCCLPYSMQTHSKQPWLKKYLYQWKADAKHRTRAMPHDKIYTRISPDLKSIPWVVVTSGNLSKAAWGYGLNTTTILNYEAGVVFFPQLLINIDKRTFPIGEPDENGTPPFPLPYDLPLTHYEESDEPFVMDFFNQ